MSSAAPVKLLLLVFGILAAASAHGAYPEEDEAADLADIKEQIEDGQPQNAATSLEQLLLKDPKNPDLLNLLGYANRKMGRLQTSRDFYVRALAIDPTHKGALEYMGELELQTGDFEAAKELLRRLAEQCPDGCEELDDLMLAFSRSGVATPISK